MRTVESAAFSSPLPTGCSSQRRRLRYYPRFTKGSESGAPRHDELTDQCSSHDQDEETTRGKDERFTHDGLRHCGGQGPLG
jgi:hypothetical protein